MGNLAIIWVVDVVAVYDYLLVRTIEFVLMCSTVDHCRVFINFVCVCVFISHAGISWSIQGNVSSSYWSDSNICYMFLWLWSWQKDAAEFTN